MFITVDENNEITEVQIFPTDVCYLENGQPVTAEQAQEAFNALCNESRAFFRNNTLTHE